MFRGNTNVKWVEAYHRQHEQSLPPYNSIFPVLLDLVRDMILRSDNLLVSLK